MAIKIQEHQGHELKKTKKILLIWGLLFQNDFYKETPGKEQLNGWNFHSTIVLLIN